MKVKTELEGKVISCMLPKGKSLPIMKALHERGIERFSFAYARGFDIHDQESKKGIPAYEEKEVLTVIAKDAKEAEELFEYIWTTAEMNRLGGGMMTLTDLKHSAAFILPEIEDGTPAKSNYSATAAMF